MSATITLGVHPQCGQKINVIAQFGRELVQAELPDGRLRLLPVRWTSLSPSTVTMHGGELVRFELIGLKLLAIWVASRVVSGASDRRKLDHFSKSGQTVAPDGTKQSSAVGGAARSARGRGSADFSSRSRTTAAVVEQVSPPRLDGGNKSGHVQRKGGKR